MVSALARRVALCFSGRHELSAHLPLGRRPSWSPSFGAMPQEHYASLKLYPNVPHNLKKRSATQTIAMNDTVMYPNG